jgi:hypothetical protein
MTSNLKLLFLFGLTLTVASCSKDDRSRPTGQQEVPTQIGTSFDRKIDPLESNFDKTIFSIKSEMSGTQGVAVYLGEFNQQKLFITNKHIINQEYDNCDSLLSLVDVQARIYMGCSGFVYSFKNLDLSILSMNHVFATDVDFEFIPLEFSFDLIATQQSFVLRTFDDDLKALVMDDSQDCVALDSTPQFITDPDPTNSDDPIVTWSLPVGCDAKPGDSGAPVFLAGTDKAYGLLWGGKYEKNYTSSASLKKQILENNPRLWSDYNFIIPAIDLKNELKAELLEIDINSPEFKTLSELYKRYHLPI